MSHHTLRQSSAAQHANSGAVTYNGKHPDGRLRITIGKQKALLHGALYRLTQKTTASGQTVTKRRLVHTTPGHQPEMLDACNLIAIGTKTSHRYRIIGQIEFCEPKLDSAENSSNPAPLVLLDAAGTPRDAHIMRKHHGGHFAVACLGWHQQITVNRYFRPSDLGSKPIGGRAWKR